MIFSTTSACVACVQFWGRRERSRSPSQLRALTLELADPAPTSAHPAPVQRPLRTDRSTCAALMASHSDSYPPHDPCPGEPPSPWSACRPCLASRHPSQLGRSARNQDGSGETQAVGSGEAGGCGAVVVGGDRLGDVALIGVVAQDARTLRAWSRGHMQGW
jgi:hypothetical protein